MAARGKTTLEQADLRCLKLAREVIPFCRGIQVQTKQRHGNAVLTLRDALVVTLAAFFNPPAQSLRLIEVMSQMQWASGHLSVQKVCKSTLSDALALFDPDDLVPVINDLMQQIPHLNKRDSDLEQVCKAIVAADGSSFALASDVAWAMMQKRGGKDPRTKGTCRLNLQLYVDRFIPADLSVSGADEGSSREMMANFSAC